MNVVRGSRSTTAAAGAAAGALAVALVLLFPRTSVAFDETADLGTIAGTRCADVVVTTHLSREERQGGGWVVWIDGQNRGRVPQTCVFEAAMERRSVVPYARAPSAPTTLYAEAVSITVAPQGTARLVRDVPGWVSVQLEAAESVRRATEAAQTEREEAADSNQARPSLWAVPAGYPDFRVAVRAPTPKVEPVRPGGEVPARRSVFSSLGVLGISLFL